MLGVTCTQGMGAETALPRQAWGLAPLPYREGNGEQSSLRQENVVVLV